MNLIDSLDPFTMRMFLFLAHEPLKSYYQRELARTLRTSLGKTNQILKLLEREELILKEERGKINLYSYNPENPIGRQLKILSTLAELNNLRKQLKETSKKIILYGSSAEGEDTSDSDLDLLVLTNEKREAEETIAANRRSIKRKVSTLILTPLEYSGLKKQDKPLYRQISRGIVLWSEK